MKRQWTRYVVVALFACLLGALAHASISRAVQGNNPNDNTGRKDRRAVQKDDGRKDAERPQNNLLRQLWDLIDQTDDLSDDEKSEAFEILEEADPILSRIKKENEQAIEILRNPPRMVVPERPAKEAEKTPSAPETQDAEKAPLTAEQDQG